jgi:putative redox protein
MANVTVTFGANLSCSAVHEQSGALIVTEAPAELGGSGGTFSPSDLLSASLGGCIISIMGIAAQSMNIDIQGATATVSKEMANNPRRIAKMTVVVTVPGEFDERQRRKLEDAVHGCPVHKALGIEVPLKLKFG